MPELCRFLGIVITMYYKDHAPPHFHAKYGEYLMTVEIETGVVNGQFPKLFPQVPLKAISPLE
jgi:hypothetical protein